MQMRTKIKTLKAVGFEATHLKDGSLSVSDGKAVVSLNPTDAKKATPQEIIRTFINTMTAFSYRNGYYDGMKETERLQQLKVTL